MHQQDLLPQTRSSKASPLHVSIVGVNKDVISNHRASLEKDVRIDRISDILLCLNPSRFVLFNNKWKLADWTITIEVTAREIYACCAWESYGKSLQYTLSRTSPFCQSGNLWTLCIWLCLTFIPRIVVLIKCNQFYW